MSYAKMEERFLDFEIRRFKNQKKIWKTKILRKVPQPGLMSGPAELKTRTSKPICSPTKRNQRDKNEHMVLDD